MISHFMGIPWDRVEELPVGAYHEMLEQCFNLVCLYTGRDFDFLSHREQREQLQFEYDMLKREGWFGNAGA